MDGFINLFSIGEQKKRRKERGMKWYNRILSLFLFCFFVRFWDQQPYKVQMEKIKRIVSRKSKMSVVIYSLSPVVIVNIKL